MGTACETRKNIYDIYSSQPDAEKKHEKRLARRPRAGDREAHELTVFASATVDARTARAQDLAVQLFGSRMRLLVAVATIVAAAAPPQALAVDTFVHPSGSDSST